MRTLCRLLAIALLPFAMSCRSHDERRALAIGTVELTAERYGWLLPKVDRVELFAFGHQAADGNSESFPVYYPNEDHVSVTNHVVLEGTAAERFASKWRKLRFWWGYASLCHEPRFGIRFFSESKPLFETALCLKCSDFSFKTKLGPQLCGFEHGAPATVAFSNAVAELFNPSKL